MLCCSETKRRSKRLNFYSLLMRQQAEANGQEIRRPSFLKQRFDDPYGLKAKTETRDGLERELQRAILAGDIGKIEYLMDIARSRGIGSQVSRRQSLICRLRHW